jgi:tetratricopeptide (TPR) repeat protein
MRAHGGSELWMWCRIAVLILSLLSARALERSSHFDEANRLYEQGKYADAIGLYENMAKSGRNSVGVFFNLGNAYFKNGELGRALLNFRKAEALAPRDPDIHANLGFARERVSGSLSVRENLWERFLTYFTANELASAAATLFWLWTTAYCLSRLKPQSGQSFRTVLLLSGGLFVTVTIVLLASLALRKDHVVIVTARQATVRLGPFSESQTAFTANDGTELRFLGKRDQWLQVSDRSGRTGWLSSTEAGVF